MMARVDQQIKVGDVYTFKTFDLVSIAANFDRYLLVFKLLFIHQFLNGIQDSWEVYSNSWDLELFKVKQYLGYYCQYYLFTGGKKKYI